MVEKRLQKLKGLASEMDEPEYYGDSEPETVLLGFGSTYGVLRETVDMLGREGQKAALLHFADLWPLPETTARRVLSGTVKSFCVERRHLRRGGQPFHSQHPAQP